MCDNFSLKKRNATDYNPQANAILEHMHQVLGDALRAFELEKREFKDDDPFEPFLSAVACTMRSACHATLQVTPGQMAFGCNMILPIQIKTDWALMAQHKQSGMNKSAIKENAHRLAHAHEVGDKALLEKGKKMPKMSTPCAGPYKVLKMHAN